MSVAAQEGVPGSTLELYRTTLEMRAKHLSGDESLEWVGSTPETLGFRRGADVTVLVNFGQDPVPVPQGEVLVSSDDIVDGMLPPDSAVWVVAAP
jgi:alpha-glucosidase